MSSQGINPNKTQVVWLHSRAATPLQPALTHMSSENDVILYNVSRMDDPYQLFTSCLDFLYFCICNCQHAKVYINNENITLFSCVLTFAQALVW